MSLVEQKINNCYVGPSALQMLHHEYVVSGSQNVCGKIAHFNPKPAYFAGMI